MLPLLLSFFFSFQSHSSSPASFHWSFCFLLFPLFFLRDLFFPQELLDEAVNHTAHAEKKKKEEKETAKKEKDKEKKKKKNRGIFSPSPLPSADAFPSVVTCLVPQQQGVLLEAKEPQRTPLHQGGEQSSSSSRLLRVRADACNFPLPSRPHKSPSLRVG